MNETWINLQDMAAVHHESGWDQELCWWYQACEWNSDGFGVPRDAIHQSKRQWTKDILLPSLCYCSTIGLEMKKRTEQNRVEKRTQAWYGHIWSRKIHERRRFQGQTQRNQIKYLENDWNYNLFLLNPQNQWRTSMSHTDFFRWVAVRLLIVFQIGAVGVKLTGERSSNNLLLEMASPSVPFTILSNNEYLKGIWTSFQLKSVKWNLNSDHSECLTILLFVCSRTDSQCSLEQVFNHALEQNDRNKSIAVIDSRLVCCSNQICQTIAIISWPLVWICHCQVNSSVRCPTFNYFSGFPTIKLWRCVQSNNLCLIRRIFWGSISRSVRRAQWFEYSLQFIDIFCRLSFYQPFDLVMFLLAVRISQPGWRPHRWAVRDVGGRFELIKTNFSSASSSSSTETGLNQVKCHSMSEAETLLRKGECFITFHQNHHLVSWLSSVMIVNHIVKELILWHHQGWRAARPAFGIRPRTRSMLVCACCSTLSPSNQSRKIAQWPIVSPSVERRLRVNWPTCCCRISGMALRPRPTRWRRVRLNIFLLQLVRHL